MKGARIAEAKRAANTYLTSAPANVEIGVLTFDDQVRLLVKPGLDRAAARTAIDGLTLTHNTALYGGVLGALDAVGPGGDNAGQRRILVLSDGHDTTSTPLSSVVDAIKKSGVQIDAVAIQQSGTESAPLRAMAAAGRGTMLDASQPTALSAAFAQEADALSRQIIVTADVPAKSDQSADVNVTLPGSSSTMTASAYVPVHTAEAATNAALPTPVLRPKFAVTDRIVLGGVVAMALGLLGIILALGMGKPAVETDVWLGRQMQAYGAFATPGTGEPRVPLRPAPG